jgi:hypothetical protein
MRIVGRYFIFLMLLQLPRSFVVDHAPLKAPSVRLQTQKLWGNLEEIKVIFRENLG